MSHYRLYIVSAHHLNELLVVDVRHFRHDESLPMELRHCCNYEVMMVVVVMVVAGGSY